MDATDNPRSAVIILHVITGMTKAAGTSVFCGEVCNGLVALGHDVTVAVVNPKSIDCYPIDPRVKLIAISSLLSCLRTPTSQIPKFDLIHIHALWSPILHKVSNWAAINEIPIVWSPHGMLTPWAMRNKRLKKYIGWWMYQKWDLAKANLLHVTAQAEVADVRRMGLRNNVVVVPLGVNICGPLAYLGHSSNKRVLLFVSRVQKKKGLPMLIDAWAQLPKDVKADWLVRIVGPDQDNHSAELKAQCERLGVMDDFEFVGPKYGDDLNAEYCGADLFVLPTHSENFASVVIEALARGLPVICTKGAPWEELEIYKCGYWIDVGVEPLANALKVAMLSTDNYRHDMGKRGRELVEAKYIWSSVVRRMIEGYGAVLGG